jgi:hypothetical protein
MLDAIEVSLIKARDNADAPNVVRVAAHASLLLLQKYHLLTDDCEVYRIAIGKSFQHISTVIEAYINSCSDEP